MSPELLRGLLTVAFGALAGGITNTLAVWMLFHPYQAPKVAGIRLRFLHGAIPKNRDRLAEAVGRAVGDRLLTPADLSEILGSPEFREAFDRRLALFLREALERERGSLGDLLPPELRAEGDRLLEELAALLAGRLDRWLDSPAFEEFVKRRAEGLIDGVRDRPIGDLLTPDREAALVGAAEGWFGRVIEREGVRQAVHDYLERAFEQFLRDDRTFEEVLPEGLVASFERALAGYLPLAVRKLGGILEDPDARRRLEAVLNELFQKFLGDLRFHQRIMARLVVTQGTVEKILATIEAEGAGHLSEMLRDPTIQDAMALRINDAVLDLLRRPVTDVLGRPGDESVERARETLTSWVIDLARDEGTRTFLAGKLRDTLDGAADRRWDDLLGDVPPRAVSELLVAGARSASARAAYREALARVVSGILERPLGRPADWLPAGASSRLREILSEPLWEWLQGQTPHVIETLNVARRVEEKVRGFPTERMEELVRKVTERELRLIVRLGYLLGAVIGGVLVTVNALLGP